MFPVSLKSSKLFLQALESAGDVFLVTDLRGNIEYFSPEFATITGYSEDEVLGKNISILQSGQHRPEFYKDLHDTLARGEVWRGTFCNAKKDGSLYVHPQTILPVKNESGEIAHYLSMWRQTASTAPPENLRFEDQATQTFELVDRFDFLLSHINAIFYTHDRSGRITYISPSVTDITGYEIEEWSTHYSTFMTSAEINDEVAIYTEEMLRSGKAPPPYNVELFHKDGSRITFEIHEAPLYEQGEIVGVLGLARDVTKELQNELRLQQAEKLESLGQLAAGVAHEINSPMQFIGDNILYLKKSFERVQAIIEQAIHGKTEGAIGCCGKDTQSQLQMITAKSLTAIAESLEGVDQIREIVQSMRFASFIGSENLKKSDLTPLIFSAVTLTKSEWKNIAVPELKIPDNLPQIWCTPGLLVQALTNILNNSIEAIQERAEKSSRGFRGKIVVEAQHVKDEIKISISDNGAGISSEVYKKLFDPFFTTKEPGKGTGQGLPFVHSVVEKHGGQIFIDSAVNRGTTLTITLPVKAPQSD